MDLELMMLKVTMLAMSRSLKIMTPAKYEEFIEGVRAEGKSDEPMGYVDRCLFSWILKVHNEPNKWKEKRTENWPPQRAVAAFVATIGITFDLDLTEDSLPQCRCASCMCRIDMTKERAKLPPPTEGWEGFLETMGEINTTDFTNFEESD